MGFVLHRAALATHGVSCCLLTVDARPILASAVGAQARGRSLVFMKRTGRRLLRALYEAARWSLPSLRCGMLLLSR